MHFHLRFPRLTKPTNYFISSSYLLIYFTIYHANSAYSLSPHYLVLVRKFTFKRPTLIQKITALKLGKIVGFTVVAYRYITQPHKKTLS